MGWYSSFSDNKFWSYNENLRTEQYNQMNKLLIEISNKFEETNKNLSNIQNGIESGELKIDEIKEDIDKVSELLRQLKNTQR